MPDSIVKHANFIVINDTGTLITGSPKIGKSEISLALIDRGHCFISDDATELTRKKNEIIGSCPKRINPLMQIDHIGLINVEKLFEKNSCTAEHCVDLCIALKNPDEIELETKPLTPNLKNIDILGIEIPCYELPVIAGKQLPLLIEIIVRNFILQKTGYNALEDLKERS